MYSGTRPNPHLQMCHDGCDKPVDVALPDSTCQELRQVLQTLGVKRMVVGHTPQPYGINSACNGGVWRVDVGMSAGVYGSPPQVLEILADGSVRVLCEKEYNTSWTLRTMCRKQILASDHPLCTSASVNPPGTPSVLSLTPNLSMSRRTPHLILRKNSAPSLIHIDKAHIQHFLANHIPEIFRTIFPRHLMKRMTVQISE
eukprot:TRINITY_DN19347_c0_g1::TRINITY_DN19347_c0_g1_i1::g.7892::m.7892 TRINITY_DN19347_c0_g1::TRINITY_DN19347_c0_g1_i1::g.7892  ORF type:complete len:200 (-),score=13.52,sp/Q8L774/SLP1_ARATH/57.14/5e-12 TRINITY_DN19347_c0_g1_i1:17-616(-)